MIGWLRRQAKSAVVAALHRRNEALRRTLAEADGGIEPRCWDLRVNAAGHLAAEGHDLVEVARQHGTPLHVVSRARLAADFERFRSAFAGRWPATEVAYSYKTNPVPGVLRELHAMGAWAEVISHFELWLALRLGVDPARIVYNGPAKSDEGLELAVRHGVGMINIDNVDEIGRVAAIAARAGRRQRVGLRLVSSVGWSGQFGHRVAGGAAADAFARLMQCPSLDACGLHIHLGTGLSRVDTYVAAVGEVLGFARRMEDGYGASIRVLDFGGGFGVPTVRPLDDWDERLMALGYPPGPIRARTVPDCEQFAEAIVALLRAHYPDGARARPLVLLEPGRAITSSAQTLLLSVLAVKIDGRERRVILDGGKNLAIPTGYEQHELLPASRMDEPPVASHSFYGPLCHPGDVLARNKRFPPVAAGDVVAVMDAGAYFIPNQMNFSNPRAAVVLVDDARCRVLRERERFEDIVRLDPVDWHVPQAQPGDDAQALAERRPA